MMRISFTLNSFLTVCVLLILFSLSSASNSSISPSFSLKKDNKLIPFNNLYLQYFIKGSRNNIPLWGYLNATYTEFSNNSLNSYNYNLSIALDSTFFVSSESATFLENSSTRNIQLQNIQGTYITYIVQDILPFNSSTGSLNWDPFWIVPSDVNTTYPIYSLYLNVTGMTTIGPSDVSSLNYTTPAIVIKGFQSINKPGENITNNLGLIYDNYTGFLLYGFVNTTVTYPDSKIYYTINFELTDTNGFSVFPPFSTSQSTNFFIPQKFQKPNYLFMGIIIIFPIVVTVVRFLRLKEISGGLK